MDDINIVAVNGDTPQEWASEATLLQVLALLRNQQKVGKRTDADQLKSLRSIMENNNDSSEELRKLRDIQGKARDEAKARDAKQKAMVAGVAKKAGVKTDGGSKQFMDAFGSDGFLGKTLGALAVAMDTFVSAVMSGVNGYNDVYRAGMTSTEASFKDFNEGFAALAVGPAKLSEDLAGYASTINQFGINPIISSSKALAAKFSGFGFTIDDTTKLAASYMERQRLSFHNEMVSGDKLHDMQIESFETTKDFSKVLGISVEKMQQLQDAQAAEVDQRLATMNMGKEQAEAYTATTALLKESGMGDVADLLNKVQVVGEAAARATPAASKILESMGPEVFNKVLAIGTGIKSGAIKSQKDFVSAVSDMAATISDPAQKQRFLAMYATGAESGAHAIVLSKDLAKRMEQIGKDTENGGLALKGSIDTFKLGFSASIDRLLSGVLTEENMVILTKGMEMLTDVLNGFIEEGNKFVKGEGVQETLQTTVVSMVDTLSTVIESLKRLPESIELLMDSILDIIGGESAMVSEAEEYKKLTGKDFYDVKKDPITGEEYDWDSSDMADIDDDDLKDLRVANRRIKAKLREEEKAKKMQELKADARARQAPINEARAKAAGMVLKPATTPLDNPLFQPAGGTSALVGSDAPPFGYSEMVNVFSGLSMAIDELAAATKRNSAVVQENTGVIT